MPERTLLSWSSGKDSAWALHVLRRDPEVEVVGLLTTLSYAFAINDNGSVEGMHLVLVVVTVLMDLGLVGASSKSRRRD